MQDYWNMTKIAQSMHIKINESFNTCTGYHSTGRRKYRFLNSLYQCKSISLFDLCKLYLVILYTLGFWVSIISECSLNNYSAHLPFYFCPSGANFILGDINIIYIIVQHIGHSYSKSFMVKAKDLFILPTQYTRYWWPVYYVYGPWSDLFGLHKRISACAEP